MIDAENIPPFSLFEFKWNFPILLGKQYYFFDTLRLYRILWRASINKSSPLVTLESQNSAHLGIASPTSITSKASLNKNKKGRKLPFPVLVARWRVAKLLLPDSLLTALESSEAVLNCSRWSHSSFLECTHFSRGRFRNF